MTSAIPPSSTRHATGRAKSGASTRAPKPSAVNQTRLAIPAPMPKTQRPLSPYAAASEPSSRTVSR